MREAREHVGREHEQRKHADALRDHTEASRETAEPVGAPVGAEQEVTQQPVVCKRDEEGDARVDLRALGLIDELECGEQRPRSIEARAVIPEPAREVVDEPQRRERREQRRQQERNAPAAEHGIGRRLRRHECGRFVGIQFAAAVRDEPVAARDHLLRGQREARLVGRPGIAQADARADQHEREEQEQPQLTAVLCRHWQH